MKISYKPCNLVFDLDAAGLNAIAVEEPRLYGEMVRGLHRQMNKLEEPWMLFMDEDELRLDKTCDLIVSPMDLTFDKKSLQKKLLAEIAEEIEAGDLYEAVTSIHAETVTMLDRLKCDFRFALEFQEDFLLEDYLKWYHVQLKDPEGSFPEQLIEYMGTIRELTGKNLFILIGCTDYFSGEDYKHLEKWVQYQEICVIFLCGRQIGSDIVANEYIIDSDLCEIH